MESTILKIIFELTSGDEMQFSISNLDTSKSNDEIKTAVASMVSSGALGVGADAVKSAKSIEKIATTTTVIQ